MLKVLLVVAAVAFGVYGCAKEKKPVVQTSLVKFCDDRIDFSLNVATTERAKSLDREYKEAYSWVKERNGVLPKNVFSLENSAKFGNDKGQTFFFNPLKGGMLLAAQRGWEQGFKRHPERPYVIFDQLPLVVGYGYYGWRVEAKVVGDEVLCSYTLDAGLNPHSSWWTSITRGVKAIAKGPDNLVVESVWFGEEFRSSTTIGPSPALDHEILTHLTDKPYRSDYESNLSLMVIGADGIKKLRADLKNQREVWMKLEGVKTETFPRFWFE